MDKFTQAFFIIFLSIASYTLIFKGVEDATNRYKFQEFLVKYNCTKLNEPGRGIVTIDANGTFPEYKELYLCLGLDKENPTFTAVYVK